MSQGPAAVLFQPTRSFGARFCTKNATYALSIGRKGKSASTSVLRVRQGMSNIFVRASNNGSTPEPERTEDTSIIEESVFDSNPQFAAVLREAVQRQGKDALTKGETVQRQGKDALKRGSKLQTEERRPSPAEEVLSNALRQARRNVLRLEELKRQIEFSIELEERQFERMQFALRRATSDAAYIRTLQRLRSQDKQRLEDLLIVEDDIPL